MSLITEALKKAQLAKLGRRYLSSAPSGVLPVARGDQSAGWSLSSASIFDRGHPSATLWVGLCFGIALFVVLFVYFFYGIGTKGIEGVKRVNVPIEKRPVELTLAAPPALPVLEATRSDRGSSLVEESSGTMKKSDVFIPQGQQKREMTTPTVRIAKTRSKGPTRAKVIVNKGKASNVPVVPELSDEVRYRFNVALFYQEEKNFLQARREYEKVVQMWPLYAEAHNNLGVVYKELGMLDQGIDHLNRALALNPEYTRAYNNLGVIHQLKGDFAQAKKKYKKALAVDRNHLSSYNNLGLVYRAEKRFHKAREILEKALAINPRYSQTHYNLALVLEELGELKRSRFHYRKFVDLAGEANRELAERVEDHLRETKAGL